MNSVTKALPNEQLKRERQRRGWSREYVAEKIGVADPKTIGRWERGYSFPSAYFLQHLCDLFGMFAQDLGLYPAPEERNNPSLAQLVKQQMEMNKDKDMTITLRACGSNDERIARVLEIVEEQDFLLQIRDGAMVIVMPLEQQA